MKVNRSLTDSNTSKNHHRYRTQLWNSDEEGTELSELRFGSKRFARIAVLEKRALEGFTPAEAAP
jgi:hypothetical protein